MPIVAENKHLSDPLFFRRPHLFRLSTEKCTGLIRQKRTSKWLFPRRRNKYYHEEKIIRFFHKRLLLKNAPNISKRHKIKDIKLIDNVHVYNSLHIASIISTVGNKTKLFPNPFHVSVLYLISTSWFLIFAQVFRNDLVGACSTALRSATDKNEMSGYATVPCSSEMTHSGRTVDWLNF